MTTVDAREAVKSRVRGRLLDEGINGDLVEQVAVLVKAEAPLIGDDGRHALVAEIVGDTYRVRRLSDGSVLPAEFSSDDVRARSQKKAGLWWY